MHLSAYLIFCLFAGTLAIIRLFLTHAPDMSVGLSWNLILAFLPYLFALLFVAKKGILRKIAFLLWLAFLPNSFYILTDFVHLAEHPDMVYFDTIYILSMAFAGLVSGYASMEIVHREWNIHYHRRLAWLYMILVVLVCDFGVYVGRFLRFNSWDIIQNPIHLMRELSTLIVTNGTKWDILDPERLAESQKFVTGAMGLWQFIVLYSAFILLVYGYLYHSRRR